MEYRKLNSLEQSFWQEMMEWKTTEELGDEFRKLSLVSGKGFLTPVTDHAAVGDSIREEGKYISTLPKAAQELLYSYFVERGMNQIEINEKLTNLYQKLYFVKAWKAYEEE